MIAEGKARSPGLERILDVMRRRLWALPQTIFGKTSAAVVRFKRLSVSRATHLPAIRAAAGLLDWLTPLPWPSVQLQSLPKRSLS
jgi:hypothetical protein